MSKAHLVITAVTVSGSGFTVSGLTLPTTLSPGQSTTLNVVFDPSISGNTTGTVVITSNAAGNTSMTVSLQGTGVGQRVQLNWDPPTVSNDQIMSYNIYRSVGNARFQVLSASGNTQTAYTDTAVQSGQTYNYYVTSVDIAGLESIPSNTTSVSVP